TTGTNAPTAASPASASTRARSAGASGSQPCGPNSVATRPTSRISRSTRSGSSWWPQPGTSQTPQLIGAPATLMRGPRRPARWVGAGGRAASCSSVGLLVDRDRGAGAGGLGGRLGEDEGGAAVGQRRPLRGAGERRLHERVQLGRVGAPVALEEERQERPGLLGAARVVQPHRAGALVGHLERAGAAEHLDPLVVAGDAVPGVDDDGDGA